VVLERDPLSLVSIIEELLETKSSGSGLENRDYGRRGSAALPRGTLYAQKLALTTLTSIRSVGIVRSRTQATEFIFVINVYNLVLISFYSLIYVPSLCYISLRRCGGSFLYCV
jgi:hypothetical protein